jgi:hypothetical protein
VIDRAIEERGMEEPMYNSLRNCPVCGAAYRDLGQGSLIGFNCGGTVQPRDNGTLGIMHPGRWVIEDAKKLTVELREMGDKKFSIDRELENTTNNLVREMDALSSELTFLVAMCRVAQNRLPRAQRGLDPIWYYCLCCGEEEKDGHILHAANCAYSVLSKGIKEAEKLIVQFVKVHKSESCEQEHKE